MKTQLEKDKDGYNIEVRKAYTLKLKNFDHLILRDKKK